jgi:hypothetical protein
VALPVDSYTLQARVVPVLVVSLPPLVLLGAGVISGTRLGVATGVVVTALAALAGQMGRDLGKGRESALWEDWEGEPTVRRLRYRAEDADRASVRRLHEQVERVIGQRLPSPVEEENSPAAADRRYRGAVKSLRALTRDPQRFGVLQAENANYGARRNLLGLRGIGIAVAATTLAVGVALILLAPGSVSVRASRYGAGIATALLALGFWLLVVRPSWVRVPAEAYADRLMDAATVLSLPAR